jgi:AdoMet-dependent rRNA methyltransferase SPB1
MPAGSIIIGVDLAPIKPIPKTITFQSDITTDKCRATIRSHLKTWKADTVLHDGAPNVGVAWVQDAYSQAALVLQSLRLATEFLVPGGTFVTKVFRSDSYNPLLWVFQELFEKVEATKPPSSRNVSAEIFVVCRGFKAPKRIDPKFLDAESVFKQVTGAKENYEVKVYKPEKKTRKREGYEEGDYMQFKELPASEFVAAVDPIALLGTVNKFHFKDAGSEIGNTTQQVLDKLEETTPEIRECCKDLKVLGRKEFKKLLQWRIRARDILGFSKAKANEPEEEEEAEVVSLDPELKMQKDLEALKDASTARKKKERRRENEMKRKEIIRMQLNMQTPMEIGIEHGNAGMGTGIFSLKMADSADAFRQMSKGRMPLPVAREKSPSPEVGSSSDEEEDRLEAQLDEEYERYLQRRDETSSKQRAKRARQSFEKEEWDGFDDGSAQEVQEEPDSGSDSDSDDLTGYEALHSKHNGDSSLTRDAQAFFGQDLFRDIDGLDHVGESDSGIEMDDASPSNSDRKGGEPKLRHPNDLRENGTQMVTHTADKVPQSKQSHSEEAVEESTDEDMIDDVPTNLAQGEKDDGPQSK